MADQQLQEKLQAFIEQKVKEGYAPCLGAIIFTKDEVLAESYTGPRVLGKEGPLDNESLIWVASMSKSVTAIVTLKVLEEYGIDLDDHKALVKILPEFELGKGEMARIITGWDESQGPSKRKMLTKPTTVPMTLRHLFTHTSGIGYDFSDPLMAPAYDPGYENHVQNVQSGFESAIHIPGSREPGERWNYGHNCDWYTKFAERLTGKSLRRLIQEHVTRPLGLKDTDFGSYVSPEMEPRRVSIHNKLDHGKFEPSDHRLGLWEDHPAEGYGSIGSGPIYTTYPAFATYLQSFFSPEKALLPKDLWLKATQDDIGARGLSMPRVLRTGQMKLDDEDPGMGWTLLNASIERRYEGPNGQATGTLAWSGIAGSSYFVDRTNNIGAMISTQFFPPGDAGLRQVWGEFERLIYRHLKSGATK